MAIKGFSSIKPTLADGVFVEESAVLYGDIQLGNDSSVWPLVAARGDVNRIRIGARTNVQDGSVLHVTRTSDAHPEGYPLVIGDDVTVGHKVMLHGCTIGDRVLVGMGAIVLDGAVVEDDVMIGAGALVPPGKRLASGYLYVGSPVKQVRALSEEEISFLKASADNYVRLKDAYLAELAVKAD
ncbi:gamma carbonic anhydrase family protein [Ferrimonas marina]|uniref:Carbonic anhydrase or acetyltransferase, isoleucine patch superfamily n=1 Tax=Ferrimonas marina TaxID=299255 RepID=A0A1M5ZHZ3_9GAMM|nr:gamma carbonic anhydrase family protein [Ferrimonas marina]SHI23543.1 Carbonic anhydrase or acetyltransferase, isoleucine patch superfamily [Ferrimonas marina]